jgi:TRAP transporter TAXI family solute receptor
MTAKYAKAAGVNVQVNGGKTLTKSMLLAAEGKVDMVSAVPAPYEFMKKGAVMYQTIGAEKGAEMAGKLRGMFGYMCGVYLPMVWDESPIKTWADLKGKRIFTGPPSGAATAQSEAFIKLMTGFEPNKDYVAVRLNWGEDVQAMRDGQLDALVRPLSLPSAILEDLSSVRPIRLLEVPADKVDTPEWKQLVSSAGNGTGKMFANTYRRDQIVNNDKDLILPGFGMMQAVGAHVPEEPVYLVTKAFFEHIDEIRTNLPYLKEMGKQNPFSVLNAPLHPGAAKYFKEIGVEIPEYLKP